MGFPDNFSGRRVDAALGTEMNPHGSAAARDAAFLRAMGWGLRTTRQPRPPGFEYPPRTAEEVAAPRGISHGRSVVDEVTAVTLDTILTHTPPGRRFGDLSPKTQNGMVVHEIAIESDTILAIARELKRRRATMKPRPMETVPEAPTDG